MSVALKTILMPSWHKDPGTDELTELLDQRKDACWDQDSLRYRADFLDKKEYDLVVGEIGKCQDDFAYAARNYFKIVTKESEDTPFSLWESQELVLEKMYQIRARGRPQKLMLIKARQLGLSTLIEALIAWRVMFFPNTAGIVVADSRPNSAELFAKLLHIYDHLPWWLKPMLDRRKEEDLLKFDNPDHEARFKNPGLHSYVAVQPASSTQGVGQSRTINCAHLSEFPSWEESKAKEIIQEDIGNALAQNVDTFAFLEGTAKGVGKFSHKFWKRMVALGEKAAWMPVFLPWFFEKSRILAPPGGWHPMQRWQDMRERVKRDWVRCPACGTYKEMAWGGVNLENATCWNCNQASLQPVVLTDAQLYWMDDQYQNNAFDSESKKILLQEMPVTAEEAFQLSGVQVFPLECLEFVERSLDKYAFLYGDMDGRGVFHAMVGPKNNRRCCAPGCQRDHQYEDHHLKVWETPVPGAAYVIGGDVAEGLGGEADYSVGWVNRVGAFGQPDHHVATYRSNEIDPISFGDVLNAIGRWYNEGLMAIECNKFDSCLYRVRSYHMYPSNFRWKIPDATNPLTNRWGFFTNQKSKPRLWQMAVLFLKQRLWIIRDETFYEEALTFQKVSAEDRGAEAELGQNDDVVMAAMIALYCSHDNDYDENFGGVKTQTVAGQSAEDPWRMSCDACGFSWTASSPEKYKRCPNDKAGSQKNQPCNSVSVRGTWIGPVQRGPSIDLGEELNSPWAGETPVPSYDSL